MPKTLLAATLAAVAVIVAAAPAQACWHNCHRPERDGPWYTYQPWTNPGYFSGVTIRIVEPRYLYHPRRHTHRHVKRRPMK